MMLLLSIALLPVALAVPPRYPNPTTSSNNTDPFCDGEPYNPTFNACWNTTTGQRLCPKVNGLDFKACGDACYNPLQYDCDVNKLYQLPPYSGPTTLQAVAPGTPMDGQYVQAIGEAFFLGSRSATYCPASIGDKCPHGYNNSVIAGSSLAVLVPGGQQMFTKNDGSIAYTQAHSIFEPDMQYPLVGGAFSNAGYFGLNMTSWKACNVSLEGVNETAIQIYADLPILSVPAGTECTGMFLKAYNQPFGTLGAWQYM